MSYWVFFQVLWKQNISSHILHFSCKPTSIIFKHLSNQILINQKTQSTLCFMWNPCNPGCFLTHWYFDMLELISMLLFLPFLFFASLFSFLMLQVSSYRPGQQVNSTDPFIIAHICLIVLLFYFVHFCSTLLLFEIIVCPILFRTPFFFVFWGGWLLSIVFDPIVPVMWRSYSKHLQPWTSWIITLTPCFPDFVYRLQR